MPNVLDKSPWSSFIYVTYIIAGIVPIYSPFPYFTSEEASGHPTWRPVWHRWPKCANNASSLNKLNTPKAHIHHVWSICLLERGSWIKDDLFNHPYGSAQPMEYLSVLSAEEVWMPLWKRLSEWLRHWLPYWRVWLRFTLTSSLGSHHPLRSNSKLVLINMMLTQWPRASCHLYRSMSLTIWGEQR